MKIICEFDSMEEFEQFRVSGKLARRKAKDEVDDTIAAQTQIAGTGAVPPAPAVQPVATPPDVQQAMVSGFPGGNGQLTPTVNPLVTAILARIDGALTSGQAADAIVVWFRQQIGPEAANATLDQIKQIFVPRMSDAQLKQIAPQLGIQA